MSKYLDWIGLYIEWLNQNMDCQFLKDGVSLIETPFLDRRNDFIGVYIKPTTDGFLLYDNEAIHDLNLSTHKTDIRNERLSMILLSHDITLDITSGDAVLSKPTTEADFGKDFHSFIQALVNIYALY